MNATRRWTLYPAGREHEPPYGTVAAAASAGAAVERFKTASHGSAAAWDADRFLPELVARAVVGHLTREPMDTDAGAAFAIGEERASAAPERDVCLLVTAEEPDPTQWRYRRAPTAAAPSKGRTPRDAPPAAAPTAARAAARASRTRVSTARRQRPTATNATLTASTRSRPEPRTSGDVRAPDARFADVPRTAARTARADLGRIEQVLDEETTALVQEQERLRTGEKVSGASTGPLSPHTAAIGSEGRRGRTASCCANTRRPPATSAVDVSDRGKTTDKVAKTIRRRHAGPAVDYIPRIATTTTRGIKMAKPQEES